MIASDSGAYDKSAIHTSDAVTGVAVLGFASAGRQLEPSAGRGAQRSMRTRADDRRHAGVRAVSLQAGRRRDDGGLSRAPEQARPHRPGEAPVCAGGVAQVSGCRSGLPSRLRPGRELGSPHQDERAGRPDGIPATATIKRREGAASLGPAVRVSSMDCFPLRGASGQDWSLATAKSGRLLARDEPGASSR